MLGNKTEERSFPYQLTKFQSFSMKVPVRIAAGLFLLSASSCIMTRAEGERLSFQVKNLEDDMAKMQRVRHDMEILLSSQKATIDRMVKLEGQLSSLRDSLADGHTKNTELVSEIQNLRNELEQAQYRYQILEEDQKSLAKGQQAIKEEQKKGRIPQKMEDHFALAKKSHDEGKLDDAIFLFELFVNDYPNEAKYIDRSYYLLGESLERQGVLAKSPEDTIRFYKRAVVAYQKLVESFSKSPLREEALFKLGLVLKAMDNKEAASAAFNELLSKHKGGKRAQEAKALLSELEKK